MSCDTIISLYGLSSLKVLRLYVDDSFVLPANSLSFPSLCTFDVNAESPGATFSLFQAMRALPKSTDLAWHFPDIQEAVPSTSLTCSDLFSASATCVHWKSQ